MHRLAMKILCGSLYQTLEKINRIYFKVIHKIIEGGFDT